MPDSSDTSPLLASGSTAQSFSDNTELSTDVAHRTNVYFVVLALFFGYASFLLSSSIRAWRPCRAMLASAVVAYNIATYALVGEHLDTIYTSHRNLTGIRIRFWPSPEFIVAADAARTDPHRGPAYCGR